MGLRQTSDLEDVLLRSRLVPAPPSPGGPWRAPARRPTELRKELLRPVAEGPTIGLAPRRAGPPSPTSRPFMRDAVVCGLGQRPPVRPDHLGGRAPVPRSFFAAHGRGDLLSSSGPLVRPSRPPPRPSAGGAGPRARARRPRSRIDGEERGRGRGGHDPSTRCPRRSGRNSRRSATFETPSSPRTAFALRPSSSRARGPFVPLPCPPARVGRPEVQTDSRAFPAHRKLVLGSSVVVPTAFALAKTPRARQMKRYGAARRPRALRLRGPRVASRSIRANDPLRPATTRSAFPLLIPLRASRRASRRAETPSAIGVSRARPPRETNLNRARRAAPRVRRASTCGNSCRLPDGRGSCAKSEHRP